MPATPTYSPARYTPATVGTTHRHSRYAETHPVQPLKGLGKTRAASVSYRASVPAGHAYCEVAPSHRALAPAADRQNRSFKALSGKGSAPAPPPPFRHTPGQSRPRQAAPVWRNLGQHPHRDDSFTFSAKEKDSETGLSYFGSRYYSSDLSIWLSVDPMSDKYAYQSGYVYCGNNPLKVIDPNGEDEWEVNEETGHIKHYSNDKPDRLFVTTCDGRRREDIDPLDVDRTVMEQMTFDGYRTTFAAKDKRGEMNQLFDYLADNTYVEWAHIGASYSFDTKEGKMTSTYDMLFTSHDYTSTSMRGELKDFAIGGFLDFHKHSHPNKYLGDNLLYKLAYPTSSYLPSPADVDLKNSFPMPKIPYRQPYFILRNVKTNIYY